MLKPGDFVVMHTLTNTWYYGKMTYIDEDCVAITNASYGQDFVPPIADPPDHPEKNLNGAWAYFDPAFEIMWMSTAIYWIAKVNKIPFPPDGAATL